MESHILSPINFVKQQLVEKSLVNRPFKSNFFQMDPKGNPGLSDETVDKFGEFIQMAEETLYLSEVEPDCSICLSLLQRPHMIDPCGHTFCQGCLARLSQAQGRNCPNCRGVINGTNLNQRLHLALQNQHQDAYEKRYIEDLESGVYAIQMDWTPVEETEEDVFIMNFGNMRITIILPRLE